MPLDYKQAAERTKELQFTWDGEPVTIRYRVHVMTAEMAKRLDELQAATASQAAIADANIALFLALVAAWDLTYDGAPWPLTAENLRMVDQSFLRAAFDAIREDRSPNRPTPSSSDAS